MNPVTWVEKCLERAGREMDSLADEEEAFFGRLERLVESGPAEA